jgi:hypothetical protein
MSTREANRVSTGVEIRRATRDEIVSAFITVYKVLSAFVAYVFSGIAVIHRAVRVNGSFDVEHATATVRQGELVVVLPKLTERRGAAHRIPSRHG